MKQVTLYWDNDLKLVWYKNKVGMWRIFNGERWKTSKHQDWKPENFTKSLTVNNFKEK